MSEPERCFGLTPDGSRCEVTAQLCPTCSKCLWHCEHRREQAAAARAKGAETTARRTSKIRTVPLDQVPPLETMDHAITASAWVYRMAASGGLDPSSAREVNRAIVTFVNAVNKADLMRRLKALEVKLRQYEQEQRSTTR